MKDEITKKLELLFYTSFMKLSQALMKKNSMNKTTQSHNYTNGILPLIIPLKTVSSYKNKKINRSFNPAIVALVGNERIATMFEEIWYHQTHRQSPLTYSMLMDKMGVSIRTIQRYFKVLRDKGLIKIRTSRKNQMTILLTEYCLKLQALIGSFWEGSKEFLVAKYEFVVNSMFSEPIQPVDNFDELRQVVGQVVVVDYPEIGSDSASPDICNLPPSTPNTIINNSIADLGFQPVDKLCHPPAPKEQPTAIVLKKERKAPMEDHLDYETFIEVYHTVLKPHLAVPFQTPSREAFLAHFKPIRDEVLVDREALETYCRFIANCPYLSGHKELPDKTLWTLKFRWMVAANTLEDYLDKVGMFIWSAQRVDPGLKVLPLPSSDEFIDPLIQLQYEDALASEPSLAVSMVTTLKGALYEQQGDTIILRVPNTFIRDQLDSLRYSALVKWLVQRLGARLKIETSTPSREAILPKKPTPPPPCEPYPPESKKKSPWLALHLKFINKEEVPHAD